MDNLIIDHIENTVKKMAVAEDFVNMNEFLKRVNLEKTQMVPLLAYLNATFPYKEKLSHRPIFVKSVSEELIKRTKQFEEKIKELT